MKTFEYTVKDELGLHARPAGVLAKEVKKYESKIFIDNGTKKAEAKKLIAVMGLAVKCGQTITVTVEGPDEETAAAEVQAFFEANF